MSAPFNSVLRFVLTIGIGSINIVKFAVDAATNSLERADSAVMPPGVDYVRSAVAAAAGTHSYFATDTSPAVIAKVRHSDLALVDVLVLDGGGEGAFLHWSPYDRVGVVNVDP